MDKTVTVKVDGIRFQEYASVRWNDYLRMLGLCLLVMAGIVAVSMVVGKGPQTVNLTMIAVLALMIFALVTMFRGNLKKEYAKSGIGSLELTYSFSASGWTVRAGKGQNTVSWDKTYRVRRDKGCLMLYPNKKSVNLIPLRCLDQKALEQILRWCEHKK